MDSACKAMTSLTGSKSSINYQHRWKIASVKMIWHWLHLVHSFSIRCCLADRRGSYRKSAGPSIARRTSHTDFDLLAASFVKLRCKLVVQPKYLAWKLACLMIHLKYSYPISCVHLNRAREFAYSKSLIRVLYEFCLTSQAELWR